ncbi:Lrp/AsnC family transcriptional regulator [Yersinia massiliensis]|jgi:Lrp/AsnC family leucine-responsive transcriptional regulator|uniref:Lrp/AsnC family transcriptional regulator n=2 Tax=Yersinia TaxID=629 RepID=A0A2R4NNL3_9GAMM|nr:MULTISPECIES: Lrp/AsnC family transcriptional regulator [Yersinia]HEC1652315.1 Lrp/AsnC family transcriptional regulator [Yersinia enterocolitica]ATM86346.1 Lrp/AsnC family transcriptional regulator [Yersinia frederiksenii]AVX37720.1 Lrp/AsnC family transcriptional regulator [Yersinia massiliensis]MCB5317204.1 Lrp/AsnC family transcriptional regulator [Yersinia massiliensis]MDA5546617.1 Lrp/AsnC family transcriptional regulator [Yersinia massiliensis]
MDKIDEQLITILAENARISLKDLSQQVNLSSPSTSERLRRFEERKIIRSYTLDLDQRAFGYALQAIVRVKPFVGMRQVAQQNIQETPECVECDKVAGDDCFISRLHIQSIDQLDVITDRWSQHAEIQTSIVKSSPVLRRLPPLIPSVKGSKF